VETKQFEGAVDRIGPDQVRIRLDDGSLAFIPRSLVPGHGGRALKVGARISVSIRRTSPDTTEEWEVSILPDAPPSRYSVHRGEGDGMKDTLGPEPGSRPGKSKK